LRPFTRTSLNHQPEAQHPKSSAIHKLQADYPIFWEKRTLSRHRKSVVGDPGRRFAAMVPLTMPRITVSIPHERKL